MCDFKQIFLLSMATMRTQKTVSVLSIVNIWRGKNRSERIKQLFANFFEVWLLWIVNMDMLSSNIVTRSLELYHEEVYLWYMHVVMPEGVYTCALNNKHC